MLRWYSASIKELEVFFGTTAHSGLSNTEAHKRIKKSRQDSDPILPNTAERYYTAKVWRSGEPRVVPLHSIALGDLIELTIGDRAPADIRLIKVQALRVDESMVTGNSHPVAKNTIQLKDNIPVQDQKNMIFAGSSIVGGSGLGIVTALGGDTEVAKTYKKPRITLYRRRIIAKLAKIGVFVQNIRALRIRSNAGVTVVIDHPSALSEIRTFVHSNQKRVNDYIFCVQKAYAGVLASELKLDVYHPSKSASYTGQQVIAQSSNEELAAGIKAIKNNYPVVLLVTNTKEIHHVSALADYVCLTDMDAPDTVKLQADFFAPNADINTIEKLVLILDKYGKKL